MTDDNSGIDPQHGSTADIFVIQALYDRRGESLGL